MRPNPFQRRATVPSGYTTSPLTFVRGTSMEYIVDPEERGRAAPGVGIYHVTTNLPAVLAEGRLRSRAELRKGGVASAGLGGGVGDERPDLVSTGMTLDGSLRVMRAVRLMADAVHARISSRNALVGMNASLEPTLSQIDDAMGWLSEEDSGWEENRAVQRFEEEAGALADRVLAAAPGPDLYDALVRYEIEVAETFTQWAAQGWLDDDAVACAMPVGFTEPAHKFERVLPENVGMVQLAARRGASVDRVPGECELRFRPEDLTLVAVWASEPTPRVRRQKRNPARPAKAPKAPKAPRTFRDLGAWTDWARTQGMTLRLARAGYGPVEVTDLYADMTGTGAGSRVMEALVAAADQQGMPLRLTPAGKRNITFYERFGFTVGRTAHDTAMHRTPRQR